MKVLQNVKCSHTGIMVLLFVLWLASGGIRPCVAQTTSVANVILLIGDGMGPEQVKATEFFTGKALFFQAWHHKTNVDTASANSDITDSAAAGTAMATGRRVKNGVISLAIPGKSNELCTALEYFKGKGKSTGLVTSDSMTGATPAAFGAHEASRGAQAGIAADYLTQTRPNVLFGGGGGMKVADAASAGYTVVTNRDGLLKLDVRTATNVAGIFGKGSLPYEYDGAGSYPHLSEMTRRALDILEKNPSGFFLMVESGNIDHACHANDLARMIPDVLEFEKTVAVVMDWAKKRSDTLVIITADHETGGLKVVENKGLGNNPNIEWTKGRSHTGTKVPLWAWGVHSDTIPAAMANTNIFQMMVQP